MLLDALQLARRHLALGLLVGASQVVAAQGASAGPASGVRGFTLSYVKWDSASGVAQFHKAPWQASFTFDSTKVVPRRTGDLEAMFKSAANCSEARPGELRGLIVGRFD